MLTASQISSALEAARKSRQALAIVSLLARHGQPVTRTLKLVVKEGDDQAQGSLGEKRLDDLAIRYAQRLLADERHEISTAMLGDIIAALNETVSEESARAVSAGSVDDPDDDPDDVRLLFEFSRPLPELIVCGGGHVGQAVARAGRLLDFRVTVIDDRAEFASRERFPDEQIELMADDFIGALQSLKISPASHIVIVTRGHKHDEMCLREVIGKPARYIGMIGSRRRTTTIRAMLQRDGVSTELLEKLHAPIGLDIGAQTPEEIAVAILAEIILVRRGGTSLRKSDFKSIAALTRKH